ncbi:hypothetical protein F4808DRAFT_444936 [Astrocystis sublimbata]|nr:hypothetical protein F4808DRAFT_444936 [Astrocystis sublimbata]
MSLCQLQYSWAWDRDACQRPNTEFDIPIVCQTRRPENGTQLPSLGVEYDSFHKCCPIPSSSDERTQWITMVPCNQQFCFTTNETLAGEFDECIYNAASAILRSINKTQITDDAYRGQCEYIDLDSLKKGVREPEDIAKGGATRRFVSWGLITTTLVAAMLGPVIL